MNRDEMSLLDYVRLIRPLQWYKNLIIFVPFFFGGLLFKFDLLGEIILGFTILCMVSSCAYIVNDIHDLEEDKRHPKKKNRPLPSGKVSTAEALALLAIIATVALYLAFNYTNIMFSLFAILLFFSVVSYTYCFRNIPIVDVNVIAFDFVIRALAGGAIVSFPFSPWLFLVVYFLALFLALGKRVGEFSLMGQQAEKYRKIYSIYSKAFLEALVNITAASVIASYALYLFIYHASKPLLVVTVPIAVFLVGRYLYFIYSGEQTAQKPERVFKDSQMISGMLLWVLVMLCGLYV